MKKTCPKSSLVFLNVCSLAMLINGSSTTQAQVGIGTITPTAMVHIAAGSSAAGSAPLKLTNGSLLNVPEPGAIEFSGNSFYMTTASDRRSVMLAQNVVMSPITAGNTAPGQETIIYTTTLSPNDLSFGKLINMKLYGRYSTSGTGNSNVFIVRFKCAGMTLLSISSNAGEATNKAFDLDIRSTIRSIGTDGRIISYGKLQQDSNASKIDVGNLSSINTTIDTLLTVSIEWASKEVSNTLSVEGGATDFVDAAN